MRARLPLLLMAAGLLYGGEPTWLDRVGPVLTSQEKKTYLALAGAERAQFEETFFERRAITAGDYYERLRYIDDTFGSGKSASGANTDPGRVYLSLGAPSKVSRFPSSRIFVPMEIWYYNDVPGLLNTELRLIFYRGNGVGFLKLYSPTVDTIRELLLPQAATVHMFGPNDSIPETDIRKNLTLGPGEDEIITAASGVASGVKYSGNDQILGQITSPAFMLGKARATLVTARLLTSPDLDVFTAPSREGVTQIDLRLRVSVQQDLNLEVRESEVTVADNRLHLKFPAAQQVEYTHRLDLLPGSYRLIFTIDGKPAVYPLEIPARAVMSEILRADVSGHGGARHTPFEFDGVQLTPDPNGAFAAVAIPRPGSVTWILRQGSTAVWKSTVQAERLAVVALPTNLAPGSYRLEANSETDSRAIDFTTGRTDASAATVLSYNANLAPADRLAFLAHQHLLRGNIVEARRLLGASLAAGVTTAAQIERARAGALAGDLDGARETVRRILAEKPDNFEALAVYAYIETRFQDYPAAAELYRRALAVQESPALRAALERVEKAR